MSQVPEIKREVNKETDKDKKKAGLLARLFGGGSEGGALGSGSLGGGGFGSALGGGGILATKAGLIALIVAGTTVAGGIGLVGYRLFGPGQDSGGGDNLSVFAPKPKDEQGSGAQNAPQDGSSKSLDFVSQANSQAKAPEVAPAEAPKDATAASAATAADASAAAARGAINAAGNSGNGVNKGLAKEGKFGKLTSSFGGGAALSGGGGSSASANGAGKSPAEMAASRNGSLGAMKKGVAESGGGRAIASRKSGRALGQAFSSLKDGRGAATSFGAGKTFDGSATTSGGTSGPEAGAIGAGPAGTADGGAPKALPSNKDTGTKEFKAPPTPDATMVAPWQGAINSAQMMLAAGALLLFLMGKVKIPWLRYVIGAIVLALGVAIVALGGKISGGQWGQKFQGNVLAAAGVGLSAAAVMAMVSVGDAPKTTGADGTTTIDTASEAKNAGVDMLGGINPYVLLGGGAAIIGVAACQMKPPAKHPASDFENGKVPDAGFFGYQQFPSEKALKKMIA
ncbi:MAG: hypothetical protein ACHQ51_11230 [Elusimicrobiota bacterium]